MHSRVNLRYLMCDEIVGYKISAYIYFIIKLVDDIMIYLYLRDIYFIIMIYLY